MIGGQSFNDGSFADNNYKDPDTGFPAALAAVVRHVQNAINGTSTSSVAISVGTKTIAFSSSTGQVPSFGVGMRVKMSDQAAPGSNYVVGILTSYNAATGAGELLVDDIGGSGTKTSWYVNLAGEKGVASGAPNTAPYLTVSADAGLTSERVITPTKGIKGTDGGANTTYALVTEQKTTVVATNTLTINDDTYRSQTLRFTHASGCAITISSAGALGDGFWFDFENASGGDAIFTVSGGIIRDQTAASTFTAKVGANGTIRSDGSALYRLGAFKTNA